MRKSLFAASMLALTVAVAPACATKKFVRTEVGNVNYEGRHAERHGRGDPGADASERRAYRRSRQEGRSGRPVGAGRAQTRRMPPQAAANEVGGQRPTTRDQRSRRRRSSPRSRKLVYAVTLSEDQGNFKFGKTDLPDEAKARLDEVIAQLKANPKNIFIEIEGHTDNVGDKDAEREARSRARRSGEAVSLRAAPGSAAQDQRDQLRRGQAGRAEQHQATAAPRTAASS